MTGNTRFEKLLEPFHIGRVQTKNRIVKTAAGTSFIEKSGYVGETIKAFYEALARGGVGLLIVESTGIDYPLGIHHPLVQLHLDDDKYISSYSELTQVIHKHGCPTFLQLFHSGPWHPSQWSGLQPLSASPPTESELLGPGLDVPRELTIPEIGELVDKFAKAAERAQKAGFDGVEINANSSHLINSFLSQAWNKRQDAYGCEDLESRARFLVEIIQEAKKRLGQDFPVSVLISGAEYGVDKGTTVEESKRFAQLLQDAGADAIQTRAFGYGDYGFIHPGPEQVLYPEPPKSLVKELDWSCRGAGAFVPLAEAIKKAVSIPVITVGRLDPELGEKILKQGKADFIGFHRRLLADPELPNKIASGRLEDIAPCTACCYCWHVRRQNQAVRCRVNAALGREREYIIKQAKKKKRVVVVGGGPAGMEAARVAALRGHEVILCERDHKLGGLIPLAAMVKDLELEDLVALVRYLKTQVTKLGITIRLGKEVNLSVIEELKPDVVILATGGILTVAEIPGINRRNVVQSSDLYHRLKIYLRFLGPKALAWLTRFWMPIGENVIIIGGAIQGCELAEFLVKRGRKVTIVDTAEAIGGGLVPEETKMHLLSWLTKKGASLMTEVRYEEITDKGLAIITKEGKRQTIEADTIVLAMPLQPNTDLLESLDGKVPEIYPIGDCREPHLIADAIADGSRIAYII